MQRLPAVVIVAVLAGCASAPAPCPCPGSRPAVAESEKTERLPDFEKLLGAVVQIKVKVSERAAGMRLEEAYEYGTGFFVDERGTILTSAHVLGGVDDPHQVTVLVKGRPLQARLGPVHRDADLATLSVDTGRTPALELADRVPDVGETVFAVGFPYADVFRNARPVVSRGQVAGTGVEIEYAGRLVGNLIVTDTFVADGCSGGPLLDTEGRVIGVLRFNLSRKGAWLGLSFAEPIGSFLRQGKW